MEKFYDLLKTIQLQATEGNFAKVGDFWKNIVFFWQHERIYYITEGTAVLILKGRKMILKPDHIYFIPANSVISAECKVFLSHHYLHFECEHSIKNLLSYLNLENEIKATEQDIALLKRAIEIANIKDKSTKLSLEVNGIIQVLLSRFLKDVIEYNPGNKTFLDIVQYIENNITEKITVKQLASMANLNEIYFSNCFKKMFDMSPLQYILHKKITQCMFLLKNSDLRIKEIAYKFGFSDELYFSRIFKNKTGLSPKEFRITAKNFSGY